MVSELRLAIRSLLKTPGFSLVIVLTLALGIGANTAIFSFFRGILLRPLPFAEPENVVLLKKTANDYGDPVGVEVGFFAADFRELHPQTQTLAGMATYTVDAATLTGRESSDLVTASIVTPNFFSLLGSPAAVGRTFTAAEASNASGRVAVLAHDHWLSHFGGNPAIVGQAITLNNVAFTVVGVMPAEFDFPREAQMWVTPAGAVPEDAIGRPILDFSGRGNYLRTMLGRLKPGVSREQAEGELAALAERLPNPNQISRSVHLVNLRDHTVGNIRPVLAGVLAFVGLVLLIACLNVANLMLSRATARERELGIRIALGAGRWRIARQLLTESTLLAVIGGVAGVLLSGWGLQLLVQFAPQDLPRLSAVHLDGWVLAFAALVTFVTGLLSGLVPVLGTGKSDLVSATKSGERGGTAGAAPRRLRSILVGGEVALSLVLLVAAGLLLRSLREMQAVSWGFNPTHVISARVAFLGDRYRELQAQVTFYRTLLEKLQAMPGVEAVGTSLDRIGETWIQLAFTPEGQVYPNPADRPRGNLHIVSPDYFQALGITLQQGRAFTERDDMDSARVIIIDAEFARRYFPDGEALGKRVTVPGPEGDRVLEVVGVVAPVKSAGPTATPRPDFYIPYLQVVQNNFYVHVRTPLDALAASSMIKQTVQAIDPVATVTDIASMEQVIDEPASARRFPLGLFGGFAALALLLAALGIYAVTSYSVAQRTREIGVRMALGAQPRAVLGLVLRQGFRPILVGMALGIAGSVVMALVGRQFLFGIQPIDGPTFVAVPLLLAAIAAAACLLPALRATRVDPLTALRAE